MAGLAGIAEIELGLFQLEQVAFDLEPGDEFVAGLCKRRQSLAVDVARAERHRSAVGEDDVAQHPAGVRRPGQHPERRRVGQHHDVGRAFPFLGPEGAAGAPHGKHRAMGGVLQQHRRTEAHAGLHRRGDLARDQCLAAQDAVLVGEGETHDRELAGLYAAFDLAHGGLALVGPETGFLGEMHEP